jgi:hypothetical protein
MTTEAAAPTVSPSSTAPDTPPPCRVAVVMEREREPNVWEAWRHRLVEVLWDEGQWGEAPRVLRDDGKFCRTLFPGLPLKLWRDEGEGYYLNLSSGAPAWFVMWRVADDDPGQAWPELVTLSYNEAGRLLDAQERVDNLPLPAEVVAWLQAFTEQHYQPEPKKRRRPASFVAPADRR